MSVVCLPWSDAETVLGVLPDGLEVVVYDGTGVPPRIDEIEFFVPPYMGADDTVAVMSGMPSLRVVQTLTAGVDNIWPHLPTGVTLCNARGVHDASTAELVVGLIVASLRRIPEFVLAQREGQWLHGRYDALADKQVLIVGYGSVGEALERRLLPFEVDVVTVARTARDGVHGFDELAGLLPAADVVVLLCPLTDATRGLVDEMFLAAMKDGSLLVNAARGPVVDTDALVAALGTGRIRAALDVTDPEPLPTGHPLWNAPGVLISPHVGGNSTAFLPRAYRLVRGQLEKFAAGHQPANVMTPSVPSDLT